MKAVVILAGGISLAIGIGWVVRNSRLGTASAPYTTVRAAGAFELRDYPALTLAVTPMENEGASAAFGRLFNFITGKNAKAEKIPMTTPVLIDPVPGSRTMSFVMPEALKDVPVPSGSGVRLIKTEAARYAVMRFAGRRTEENQRAAAEKLQIWLQEHHIEPESGPLFAYFDPPWTFAFLRRNEVMVRVPKETQ